jgi:hypothetical protein
MAVKELQNWSIGVEGIEEFWWQWGKWYNFEVFYGTQYGGGATFKLVGA